jgi:hypothetical protein
MKKNYYGLLVISSILLMLVLVACENSKKTSNSDQSVVQKEVTDETSQETSNNEKGDEEDLNKTQLRIDFGKRDGVPLLKKYSLFNSGIVPLSHYERDAYLFDELRAESLRIDLYMGDRKFPFGNMIGGTADNLTYDFTKLDSLIDLLGDHGVKLYASWSYIPTPLQIDNDWRNGPSDLAAWQEMFRTFAEHYKELGVRIPYHEVYNEPDCGDTFFLGNWDDYTQMYIAAARGLLEGDKDVVIGGPSSAFVDVTGKETINDFLDKVKEAKVPLDFFSYHSYGCDMKQYLVRTNMLQSILGERPEYDTTELHLNEYNSLIQPFLLGEAAEKSRGGATMLTSFELLLDETDVTMAGWAQFMDTGYEPLGAIDPKGRLKAPYWALWMYSQMPEERVKVEGLPDQMEEGLHAMASADETKAAILVWNDSQTDKMQVEFDLISLPVKKGEMRIYKMDDIVDNYFVDGADTSIKATEVKSIDEVGDKLSVNLEPSGFTLFLFDSGNAEEENEALGSIVRKYYSFAERHKKNYSFFDETDNKVYLGMNGEVSARSVVAVEYKDLPDMFYIHSDFTGTYENIDYNTSFNVRIDYEVDGEYTWSYMMTYMPINERRDQTINWGTRRKPDEIEVVSTLLTGKSLVTLKSHAPEGWDGRAIITFDMNSTGKDTRTEITMNSVK